MECFTADFLAKMSQFASWVAGICYQIQGFQGFSWNFLISLILSLMLFGILWGNSHIDFLVIIILFRFFVCFSVNFAKFLRAPLLKNTSRRLLLKRRPLLSWKYSCHTVVILIIHVKPVIFQVTIACPKALENWGGVIFKDQ